MSAPELPPLRQRIVERSPGIEYLFRAGYTPREIARTLNIPTDTVRRRLYRLEPQR